MTSQHRLVAIVTDGMFRKSLSAIRSLGKAGFAVHVTGDSWLTVGFWSRFTARRVLAPDAKDDLIGFSEALTGHLRGLQATSPVGMKPVLLPMEDDTFQFVVDNAEALRPYADFIVPDPTAFRTGMDKAATMALAGGLNLPHPRTEVADSVENLSAAIARMSRGEFIVKPARGSGSRGVRYNSSFNAAEAASYLRNFGAALVQEQIPPGGDAVGVSVLFGPDGRRLAHFCHKRLRQFPNSGGPSTDRIGIADGALLDMSLELLTAIGWKGVAMVEWKIDLRTGAPQLMEINPRFWGSLELAVRSGVDFPALYARAAAGQVQAPPEPIIGVRCRWLIPGDILRWLTADRRERESLRTFCSGLPWLAEEWDSKDLRGFLSCILCQALALLRPKYRKLLRR
ncbi:MAG: ATP-grasp domain-containing protein [Roseiarcus sp.]